MLSVVLKEEMELLQLLYSGGNETPSRMGEPP